MHFKTIHKTVPPEYQDKPQYTCESCDYFCFTKLGLDLHHRNKHTDNPAPKRNTKLKMSQKNCPIIGKVIIHKSRGGVSLAEQDTIEYVSCNSFVASEPPKFRGSPNIFLAKFCLLFLLLKTSFNWENFC